MNLLVTGGAGFIGSNFIYYWLEEHPQDEIINLDKLTYAGNLENLEGVENNKNHTFVKGDIADKKILDEILPKVDIVVNFAAESHVDNSIDYPEEFVKNNILGTQILLEQCLKHKIKHLHHISTDEVFGDLDDKKEEKFSEDTPYEPKSPYSASKAASDHLIRAYANTFDLKYTITNCSNNFGPYQHPEKLIPKFITNLLQDKKVPVYGDGQQVRDWLYVKDHCRAIDLVINKGRKNQTYIIGGNYREITNLELTKKLLKILDKDEKYIDYVKDRPGHDKIYAVDWTKAKEELGYKPKHDFEDYLEKTVDWYKKNREWWEKLI